MLDSCPNSRTAGSASFQRASQRTVQLQDNHAPFFKDLCETAVSNYNVVVSQLNGIQCSRCEAQLQT